MELRDIDKVFTKRSAILALIIGSFMFYLTNIFLALAFSVILFGLFQAIMESRYNKKCGALNSKAGSTAEESVSKTPYANPHYFTLDPSASYTPGNVYYDHKDNF